MVEREVRKVQKLSKIEQAVIKTQVTQNVVCQMKNFESFTREANKLFQTRVKKLNLSKKKKKRYN